jgi:magnesium chelatase family protein
MLATISSAALRGIEAELVQVEVNANERGDPRLILVGLPGAAVKESDDRVNSALTNSGFELLRTRTTINLAPAHIRKEGPIYDLPIALGILIASGQLSAPKLSSFLVAGELSLSGATRPVRGGLAMARLALRMGKRGILLPGSSAEEAALVDGVEVYRVDSLDRAARFLSGESLEPIAHDGVRPQPSTAQFDAPDFAEIKGQAALRRAIEVAVAGTHNLLIMYHFNLIQLTRCRTRRPRARNPNCWFQNWMQECSTSHVWEKVDFGLVAHSVCLFG